MLDKDKLLNLENKTVFLDIDGTIVFDGQKDVDPEDVLFVKKLQEKNKIAVVSNGNIDRNDYIANILGVLCIKNSIKKPNKDSVGDCLFDTNKVVVGDKYFTDGILALNIGAEFIKVKRLYSGRERLVVKLAYLYDFLFGYIFYKIYPFIKIMRINHWIKNFIIFSPLFFASNIFNFELLHKLILSFLSFSFLASAVYIFNDICDIKKDGEHKVKSFRPLPLGIITKKKAYFLMFLLLFVSFIFAINIDQIYLMLLLYIFFNLIYSLYIKKKYIFDLLIIPILFVIRVLVGGLVASVYISSWIILAVFFVSLFTTSLKRYSQILANPSSIKYSPALLKNIIFFSSTLSIGIYSIWSILEHENIYLVYSSVFVVFAIIKMLEYIYKAPELLEFPESIVFRDRAMLVSFIGWLLFVFYIFYLT